ncbi:hypothetical protein QFC21_001470 [Naganishia friedmannii]|uniref:Uncharacterized protein n=1 Tax=Naganishia friedmannii TaxID=89922 RepID=A0ACC2W4Z3_9TREE|nr:hypothetical protein QFC21_001470 [Naganishia friedmannii]
MPISTTLTNGVPEGTVKLESKLLDYDALESIISVYVHDEVKDPLAETQEAALRREARCLKLEGVSWLFKNIVDRQLFIHLHFPTIDAVHRLTASMQIAQPKAFLDKIRMHTRCVSFGFTFDAYDTSPEYTLVVTTIKSILEVCGERLRGFRQLGPYMSPLPAPLWKTLRTRCQNLEYLDGFGFCLDAASQTGQAFIQYMFAFRKLRRLTTSVVWLPPTFIPEVRRPILMTEEEKRRSGLLDRKCRQNFAQLESLRTPLVQWDNLLVEALLIADLPKLRNLQLGIWESETVVRFLIKHGPKLVNVDLLLYRWSIWPWTGESQGMSTLVRTPQKFQIEHLFEHCPGLRTMTLHQNQALAGLVNRAGLSQGKLHLETLRLGSNDDGSYAAMLEYQPLDEKSFAFTNMEELELTQKQMLTADWKSVFPDLREIVVYWPGLNTEKAKETDNKEDRKAKEVKREPGKVVTRNVAMQRIQVWREALEKQAITLSVQEPPLETA